MRETLLAYGFRASDIRVLIDRLDSCPCPFCSGEVPSTIETPTREGIRSAVKALSSSLEADEQAVLYFSGHGSEIAGGGLHSGQRFQTLVPHDSGRGTAPNRDITDWEIEGWIRALGRRTRFATLIFDCCHSGGCRRSPLWRLECGRPGHPADRARHPPRPRRLRPGAPTPAAPKQ